MGTPRPTDVLSREGPAPEPAVAAWMPLLAICTMWALCQMLPAEPGLRYAPAFLWGPLFGFGSHVFWRRTSHVALLPGEAVLLLGNERIPLRALRCVAPYGSKKQGPALLIVWWCDERGLPRVACAGFFAAPELRAFARRVCDEAGIDRRVRPPGSPFPARDVGGAFVGTALVAQASVSLLSAGTVWSLGPTLCLASTAAITCLLVRTLMRQRLD